MQFVGFGSQVYKIYHTYMVQNFINPLSDDMQVPKDRRDFCEAKRHWILVRRSRIAYHRAAYWRWAGFLALNFNRRTEVEFCTSVDTKPFSPPIANTMLYDVVMFWVLVQLNIFVCHFLIYPGICTLIFLTIQFLFLKLNQSLKIEQSNFPLYRSLKMFVLF